ncbi:hypothetical protein [Silvimonas amylolytica]|uniref:hypothetical protein n=1 Tax=Silvimonas amylolytica TaxID=449663 RepID=UPI00166DD941|nr:hypothetical protein [Silvimonas amylolytica]
MTSKISGPSLWDDNVWHSAVAERRCDQSDLWPGVTGKVGAEVQHHLMKYRLQCPTWFSAPLTALSVLCLIIPASFQGCLLFCVGFFLHTVKLIFSGRLSPVGILLS